MLCLLVIPMAAAGEFIVPGIWGGSSRMDASNIWGAKIWSEALGVTSVGIHALVFDLGGDSITAARIVSAIGRIFPWNLTLAEFYDAGTVAQAAQLLVQKAPSAELAEKVAILFIQV